MTTIFQPLSRDVEMKLTLQIRYYNGIDSDPRVITREPTLSEILAVAAKLRPGGNLDFSATPTLDYPEQDARRQDARPKTR